MADVFRKEYRELTEGEKLALEEIKNHAQHVHDLIDSQGASRELSLAKTKLEEAVMWAVKHITR